jgi:hypothetical protein
MLEYMPRYKTTSIPKIQGPTPTKKTLLNIHTNKNIQTVISMWGNFKI